MFVLEGVNGVTKRLVIEAKKSTHHWYSLKSHSSTSELTIKSEGLWIQWKLINWSLCDFSIRHCEAVAEKIRLLITIFRLLLWQNHTTNLDHRFHDRLNLRHKLASRWILTTGGRCFKVSSRLLGIERLKIYTQKAFRFNLLKRFNTASATGRSVAVKMRAWKRKVADFQTAEKYPIDS